jgi:hypothetical protein
MRVVPRAWLCIEEINFLYRLYKPARKYKALLADSAAMPRDALRSTLLFAIRRE